MNGDEIEEIEKKFLELFDELRKRINLKIQELELKVNKIMDLLGINEDVVNMDVF